MKKGQGLAVGALFAAAFLLRPTGLGPAQGTDTTGSGSADTKSAVLPALQVGSWIASCAYWAPARIAREEPPESPPEVHGTLGPNGQVNLHVGLDATEEKQAAGCSSDYNERWGLPDSGGLADVTAIVATVPDPVHTHLALAYDRTVQAILQAAGDNKYVSAYYWLPWKTRGSGLKSVESNGDFEPGHDPERERQPGLVILKPASGGPPESFYHVIYVFLIAETPTQGVDGFQLQNAFLYEAQLKLALRKHGGRFSTGAAGHLSIIGPQYSGSAASLRAGIEAAQKNRVLDATEIEVTGAATTPLSVQQMAPKVSAYSAKVQYLSFGEKEDFDKEVFLYRIHFSKYDMERVALLVEDNTAFGAAFAKPQGKVWKVISFPREISLLRNAQATDVLTGASAPSSGTFSPYLHFSLKDYSAQDSIPQFSRENTPLTQEAVLMTIARQLRRYRAQFIAILASNALDQIFLAQFLHRACPDARLLFFVADLLMVREVDNVPFIGSVTITPYPLIGLDAGAGGEYRAYSDSESQAFYNAVAYTFWRISPNVDQKAPGVQGYHDLFAPYLFASPLCGPQPLEETVTIRWRFSAPAPVTISSFFRHSIFTERRLPSLARSNRRRAWPHSLSILRCFGPLFVFWYAFYVFHTP